MERIERLTEAGRTEIDLATGHSSSELDGYASWFRLKAWRNGDFPGETQAQARARALRECYREETRWKGSATELRRLLTGSGFHCFRLYSHTAQFELKEKLPWRAYSIPAASTRKMAAVHRLIPVEGEEPGQIYVSVPAPPMVAGRPYPRGSAPPVGRKCIDYRPGKHGDCWCERCLEWDRLVTEWRKKYPSSTAQPVRAGTKPHEPRAARSAPEQSAIDSMRKYAKQRFAIWKSSPDPITRIEYLFHAIEVFEQARLASFELNDPHSYWARLLSDACISDEQISAAVVGRIEGLQDQLERVQLWRQVILSLQWRSRHPDILSLPRSGEVITAIAEEICFNTKALNHWRTEVRNAIRCYKSPVIVEI